MSLQPFRISTSDGDAAIAEVLSDVVQTEVGRFLCLAALLSSDEKLYDEYWNLSGDGRLVVKRCYSRLTEVLRRDAIEQ